MQDYNFNLFYLYNQVKDMNFSTFAKLGSTAFVAAALTACSSTGGGYQPIIDTAGQDMSNYQYDLSQCQAYADQVSATGDAAVSAVSGAALGALVGLVGGSHGHDVARGAGVGGVTGLATGVASGYSDKHQVIRNCLSGRGYRVLGG